MPRGRPPKQGVHPVRATGVPQSDARLLPDAKHPVPPPGPQPQLGADEAGAVPRSKSARSRHTLARDLEAAALATPPLRYDTAHTSEYHSAHLAAVLTAGGPADAGGQPPAVGQAAGGLAPGTQAFQPTEQAGVLPVTALGANIRATLSRAAPECAAVLFEHINRLSNLARYAESNQLYAEAMEASNLAGRLAIKTIELTVGKQLNIKAEITGQSSIPKWDKLPPEAKDYYRRMSEELAKLPEPVVQVIHVPPTEPLDTQLDGEQPYSQGDAYDSA